MTRPPRLVLASGSPQRRAILELLGVEFLTLASGAAELDVGDPSKVALENALRKAQAVAASRAVAAQEPLPVLGVDTLVAAGSPAWEGATIYGKPADEAAARATLGALSGGSHVVVSGLALLFAGRPARRASVNTTVRMRRLDQAMIDWYVGCGEWRGRAGGYAIQGRGIALVAGIDGDYSNVVGLPVPRLLELWPELLAP